MQIERNIEQGGIILFDIDEIEADCAEDGESHQIHIIRPLTRAEWIELALINPEFDEDGDGGYDEIEGPSEDFRCWLDCGALSEEARDYLSSLKA